MERCEGWLLLNDGCSGEHCPDLSTGCSGCGAKHEVDCECQGFIVFAKLDTKSSVVWLTHDRSWSDDFFQKPMQHTLERAENFVNRHIEQDHRDPRIRTSLHRGMR